jgi:hypothetical protein
VLRVRKLAATVRRAERHEHRQREVVVLVLTIPEGVADGCARHARRPREQLLLFVQLLLTTATLLPLPTFGRDGGARALQGRLT